MKSFLQNCHVANYIVQSFGSILPAQNMLANEKCKIHYLKNVLRLASFVHMTLNDVVNSLLTTRPISLSELLIHGTRLDTDYQGTLT